MLHHPALEIDKDKTLEQKIVEHEIDPARMIRVERYAVLTGDKRETSSEFEEKVP